MWGVEAAIQEAFVHKAGSSGTKLPCLLIPTLPAKRHGGTLRYETAMESSLPIS